MPNKSLGDRRESVRFDVFGELWASLDLSERVTLRNIAADGLLIEARLTPGLRSMRVAQIRLREGGPEVHGIVRHMRAIGDATEERYLVGLEFVSVSSEARSFLDGLLREWNRHADL
jgi:hypothetical protein